MSAQSLNKKYSYSKHQYSSSNPFNDFYPANSPSVVSPNQHNTEKRDRNWEYGKRQNKIQRFSAHENLQTASIPRYSVEKVNNYHQAHFKQNNNYIHESGGNNTKKLSVKMLNNFHGTETKSIGEMKQTLESQTGTQISSKFTEFVNNLKKQIDEQERKIEKLQTMVQTLIQKVKQKQTEIQNLTFQMQQNKGPSNPQQTFNLVYEEQNSIYLKKVEDIEAKFNTVTQLIDRINEKMGENQTSVSLNTNLIKIFGGRQIVMKNKWKEYLDFKDKNQNQQQQIYSHYFTRIKDHLAKFKDHLMLDEVSLERTAKFPMMIEEDSTKQGVLQSSSSSYFFHPSQLKHLNQIQELFKSHFHEPLRCYLDEKNRLKYQQSNTFVFDRKGNTINLSDAEKRYYKDRGLMIYK